MRTAPSIAAAALAALALAAPASAQSGGGTFYDASGGGAAVGNGSAPAPQAAPKPKKKKPAAKPRKKSRKAVKRAARGPVLSSFSVSRPRLFLLGRSARVRFKISGRSALNVKLVVAPAAGGKAVSSIPLGLRAAGRTHSVALTGREDGTLPQGRYTLRIGARDSQGRGLRAGASASRSADLSFYHHTFPITGTFSYGGEGSRFGAGRTGHRHQGQDMSAAEGTPVVAPRGGVVEAVRFQKGGAGHYVVVDGEGEDRDYVFMHLRTGSIPVGEGQRVRTGQRIGEVGSTGSSSGPHLHFEVWTGGWFEKGGGPVDPLPLLRAWDSWS